MVSASDDIVLQPRNDKRQYRHIKLANEMEALLVSDPETDKAAAAMGVRAGYFLDPDDVQGLAHFLEHMLFYASEKYPMEDDYSKFLAEHGGRSNAFTSTEETNFHFDVNWEYLEPALDRFAQFFICPLLSADGVNREMNAVHSEDSKNKQSDPWRINQLQKHFASPKHPYHKFGTGNLQTLDVQVKANGKETREELLKYYKEYYSANLMRLVVYGRESLDDLQNLVESKFSAVQNTGKPVRTFPGQVCDPEHLKLVVKAVPVTENNSLMLVWPVLPELKHYKAAPSRYLGHLLGHEGGGSLFSVLKKLGWASGLSAGEADNGPDYGFFMLAVDLTDEGQQHAKEVAALAFQYIGTLREQGVERWIFEEVQAVCQTKFHFQDKIPPFQYVTRIASNMQIYPPEDYLAGPYLPREFSEEVIHETLDSFTIDNVRIFWLSKKFEGQTTSVEPWYGTNYEAAKLSDDWVKVWTETPRSNDLHLPEKNIFIPTDFSLKEPELEANKPRLVRQTPFSRLWYKSDLTFKTPKAYVVCDFISPESYHAPENSVLTRLFSKLLVDYLNEYAYYAEIAGLAYEITNTVSGFQLTVQGYNHKLLMLAEKILERVVSFEAKEDRFQIIKERVHRDYLNAKYEQPYQQAMYHTSMLLEQKRWHIKEYLEVLPDLTPKDLTAFYPRLLSRLFVECFIAGNLSSTEAESFVSGIEQTFQQSPFHSKALFPSQHFERRVVCLARDADFYHQTPILNPADQNSALVLYYQVGMDDPKQNVLTQLLVQVAKREVFYQLRTIEQLGYIVFLMLRGDYGVGGAQFIIQSDVKDPAALDGRVENFLTLAEVKLASLSEEEFKSQVETLASLKLEKFKNLGEEFHHFWREIDDGTLNFDRREVEVGALRKLQRQDLVDFFNAYFKQGGSNRRKLSVQVYGGKHLHSLDADVSKASDADVSRESLPQAVQNGPSPSDKSIVQDTDAAKGSEGRELQDGSAGKVVDVYSFKRSQALYDSNKGRLDRLAAML